MSDDDLRGILLDSANSIASRLHRPRCLVLREGCLCFHAPSVANNLTLDSVLQTVRDATAVGAGGFVDTANQRLAIRHIPSVYSTEGLGEVVVAYRSGVPLTIRDVAEVLVDSPPPIGDAIINSQPGLLLIVEKQPWANTLDVTRNVEAAMQELAPETVQRAAVTPVA